MALKKIAAGVGIVSLVIFLILLDGVLTRIENEEEPYGFDDAP